MASLWRDRLIRRTLLGAGLAVAAIIAAMRELELDPDRLLGYLGGSALLVFAVVVPAAALVWVIKMFRR